MWLKVKTQITSYILCIGIVLIGLSGYSQLNPEYLTHYNDLEGTYINDIVSNKQGRLWISTQNGLIIFDGYEERRFQPDEQIGTINIVPQDMSRVILNIITNAFQACNEYSMENQDATYAPKVVCSTSLSPLRESEGGITIAISDNGGGIPQDVIDKIFQPFFTTKPTGQGTGLGLSMAYDIVKVHGGELTVESTEGEGSEFRIVLPV